MTKRADRLIERTLREALADRLARALKSTTDRYLAGAMSRTSWSSHMTHLWAKAEDAGVKAEVLRLVDPLSISARRRF